MELVFHIKIDLVLNNLQRLIYHKTQQTKPSNIIYTYDLVAFYQILFLYNLFLWRCFVLLLKGIQFLLRISFQNHVQGILWAISPIFRLKYPYICFSFHFCFLIFVVSQFIFKLPLLLLAVVIIFFFLFLMCPSVSVFIHLRNLQSWRVLFLLFLIYKVCLHHLFNVRGDLTDFPPSRYTPQGFGNLTQIETYAARPKYAWSCRYSSIEAPSYKLNASKHI